MHARSGTGARACVASGPAATNSAPESAWPQRLHDGQPQSSGSGSATPHASPLDGTALFTLAYVLGMHARFHCDCHCSMGGSGSSQVEVSQRLDESGQGRETEEQTGWAGTASAPPPQSGSAKSSTALSTITDHATSPLLIIRRLFSRPPQFLQTPSTWLRTLPTGPRSARPLP